MKFKYLINGLTCLSVKSSPWRLLRLFRTSSDAARSDRTGCRLGQIQGQGRDLVRWDPGGIRMFRAAVVIGCKK